MKKMLVLLAVFVVVSVAVYATAAPPQVVFEAKNGNVTFNHTAHEALGECASCHHTGDNAACRSCHDGTAASSTKAPRGEFHTFCIDCHKGAGMKGMCNECHKK